MSNNGLLGRFLPAGAVPVGAQPQQPQMVIAQPFNDIQLVAMIAGTSRAGTAAEAVKWAVEIVAHAVVDGNPAAITRRVQKLKEQRGLDG